MSRAIARSWPILVVCLVAGALLAVVAAALMPKSYSATASVLVTPDGVHDTGAVANGRTVGLVNMDTESQLVASQDVARLVQQRDRSTRHTSIVDLLKNVSVTVPANTSVLDVTYTAPSAAEAARRANDFADAYLGSRTNLAKFDLRRGERRVSGALAGVSSRLQTVTAELKSTSKKSASYPELRNEHDSLMHQLGSLFAQRTQLSATAITPGSLITTATPPHSPSAPVKLLWAAGGAAIGLLVGLVLVQWWASRHRRIKRVEDLTDGLGLPLLAEIRSDRRLQPAEVLHRDSRRLFNALDAALPWPGAVLLVGVAGTDPSATLAHSLAGAARWAGTEADDKIVDARLKFVGPAAADSAGAGTAGENDHPRGEGGYLFLASRIDDLATVQAVARRCEAIVLVLPLGARMRAARQLLDDLDRVGAQVAGAVLAPPARWWAKASAAAAAAPPATVAPSDSPPRPTGDVRSDAARPASPAPHAQNPDAAPSTSPGSGGRGTKHPEAPASRPTRTGQSAPVKARPRSS